jgi:phenylalanyl-tRNA synthetase alpha chain
MIGREVTLGTLKGVLTTFFEEFFGKETMVRLRPSYFPFVEPGVEVDMSCFKCEGDGCSICKHTGWIEIMGAGMVHPQVLENVKIDPREWQGFAFGAM